MRNNWYLVFLCVAIFVPYIATAQFFAKQNVAVWEIWDSNNDVSLAEGTKAQILASLCEAFTGSEGYEAYNVNIEEIKTLIKTRGLSDRSPVDITNIIREKNPKVNYVVFSKVGIVERSNYYDDYTVMITSEFFSTLTKMSERVYEVKMKSNVDAIPAACKELIEGLLRESLTAEPTGNPQASQSPQPSVQSQTQQYYVEDAGCGLNMRMIYVEGGTFQMGATPEQGSDAASDEKPVHSVTLEGYYIAECEVTQEQWQKIMGTTIYQQRDKANTEWSIEGNGPNYPMYYVSWHEAQKFCGILSEITGKTYMLPTEAQWEYAARGGNKSKGYKYSGSNYVETVAWYSSNGGSTNHPVKGKKANELGLYDMSGNVYEWCYDWYDSYSASSQSNPTGASSGQYRVLRGGSWGGSASYCRISNRHYSTPTFRFNDNGFRVVCIP